MASNGSIGGESRGNRVLLVEFWASTFVISLRDGNAFQVPSAPSAAGAFIRKEELPDPLHAHLAQPDFCQTIDKP